MAELEQTSPIRIHEPAWAPTTVFGSVLTMRHQYEAVDTIREWGLWERARRADSPVDQRVERDAQIVRAARRWHGDPMRPPASGRFVPGDVAAMRFAVVKDDIAVRMSKHLDSPSHRANLPRTVLVFAA